MRFSLLESIPSRELTHTHIENQFHNKQEYKEIRNTCAMKYLLNRLECRYVIYKECDFFYLKRN